MNDGLDIIAYVIYQRGDLFSWVFLLHTLNVYSLNNDVFSIVEEKFLREQQVHSLVLKVTTMVSLLQKIMV